MSFEKRLIYQVLLFSIVVCFISSQHAHKRLGKKNTEPPELEQLQRERERDREREGEREGESL